jgi:protoporphyrinogen/coproporphyrinogen III oxidase
VTSDFDVAILGGGISGLSFALQAARAGLQCVVIEQNAEPGGCIHTIRTPEGFWFELGAHTLYNSYGSLLEMIEAAGGKDQIQKRRKAPFRLLVDNRIRSIPSQLALWELFASAWRVLTLRKEGRTVEEYYGRLVGRGNWKRVVAPLLSAPFSQPTGGFPADMLFKRRPRRKDFPRAFTFAGGLGSLVERMSRHERITIRTGAEVHKVEREGPLVTIDTAEGGRTVARRLALALPPATGARLLAEIAPSTSRALAAIASADIVSTGIVVARDALSFPRVLGLAPLNDAFFSVVTRDVVEDERYRGLAFHFRSGLSLDERLDRIAGVTGTPRTAFLHVAEHKAQLPSLGRDHAQIVRDIDAGLGNSNVYVTGNYFGGLAIEDCVLRSRAEVDRLLRESRGQGTLLSTSR